jgi:uncharacterized membrane protein HdeD (DUF308 family)
MTEDMQAEATATMDGVGKLWWLWLVAGIAWLIIGYIIFQYDEASITAVGLLIGVMFLIAGLQYVIVGTQVQGWNWLWYIFGGVLIIGGLAAMFNPQRTFVSIANILGFIFLMVGIIWIIEAFAAKDYNDLWWLTLIAGILMILLAIWLGNRFIFAKAETLLIFAGVWAMMRGIIDIINAFHIRKVGKLVAGA